MKPRPRRRRLAVLLLALAIGAAPAAAAEEAAAVDALIEGLASDALSKAELRTLMQAYAQLRDSLTDEQRAAAERAGGEAPHEDAPIRQVTVRIEGKDHSFGHRAYPELLVLDLSQASGARDTPYHTLLSYHRALANVDDYTADLAPFLRTADGAPPTPPPDEAQHNEAARVILSGDVVVYGEIHHGAYTIFITRYTKSIPRNLGIAIRRFDAPDHVVVQDLILHDPLAHALSASRWEVDVLEAKYPTD